MLKGMLNFCTCKGARSNTQKPSAKYDAQAQFIAIKDIQEFTGQYHLCNGSVTTNRCNAQEEKDRECSALHGFLFEMAC
ncbi:hypothetical protein BPIT_04950 [Candidatus Brocadia pituitae]|nr:hypothetical protein BPIT_04950 [Candidatus Brocadia pituitae]